MTAVNSLLRKQLEVAKGKQRTPLAEGWFMPHFLYNSVLH